MGLMVVGLDHMAVWVEVADMAEMGEREGRQRWWVPDWVVHDVDFQRELMQEVRGIPEQGVWQWWCSMKRVVEEVVARHVKRARREGRVWVDVEQVRDAMARMKDGDESRAVEVCEKWGVEYEGYASVVKVWEERKALAERKVWEEEVERWIEALKQTGDRARHHWDVKTMGRLMKVWSGAKMASLVEEGTERWGYEERAQVIARFYRRVYGEPEGEEGSEGRGEDGTEW